VQLGRLAQLDRSAFRDRKARPDRKALPVHKVRQVRLVQLERLVLQDHKDPPVLPELKDRKAIKVLPVRISRVSLFF